MTLLRHDRSTARDALVDGAVVSKNTASRGSTNRCMALEIGGSLGAWNALARNGANIGSVVHMDQPNNPLHGKTLEMILKHLVDRFGWEEIGSRITIRCFTENPSISSSLNFLRKTPWARKKVERLYLECIEPHESPSRQAPT